MDPIMGPKGGPKGAKKGSKRGKNTCFALLSGVVLHVFGFDLREAENRV